MTPRRVAEAIALDAIVEQWTGHNLRVAIELALHDQIEACAKVAEKAADGWLRQGDDVARQISQVCAGLTNTIRAMKGSS
jgi:hypothetical protein